MSERLKVAELTVPEAQGVLQRAEEKERKERYDKMTMQLAQVDKQRVQAQAEYQKIAGTIKREREERQRLRFELRHMDSLLAQHAKIRPATADYLPSDKDVFVWTMQQGKLEHARENLMAQLKAVPDSMDANAAQYEGPFGLLAVLENSERDLLNALDPAGRDAWLKGGVFPVSDM